MTFVSTTSSWTDHDPTQPIGLLDWELATVGDPLLDLANTIGYWVQADDARLLKGFRRQPTHLPGMMTRDQVVAHYCAQTGTTVTNRQWAWYQVFGVFRVAVIAQQIYHRYMTKQTTNKQFRSFGIAVVLFELRCRRIIAEATRMPPEIADAPVGSLSLEAEIASAGAEHRRASCSSVTARVILGACHSYARRDCRGFGSA